MNSERGLSHAVLYQSEFSLKNITSCRKGGGLVRQVSLTLDGHCIYQTLYLNKQVLKKKMELTSCTQLLSRHPDWGIQIQNGDLSRMNRSEYWLKVGIVGHVDWYIDHFITLRNDQEFWIQSAVVVQVSNHKVGAFGIRFICKGTKRNMVIKLNCQRKKK